MPKYTNTSSGVLVQGLDSMQRVLKVANSELAGELRKRLAGAVEVVHVSARENAAALRDSPYNFGKPLSQTLKVSVTQRSASVYSTAVWGGAQNYGGQVGRGGATLLRRDSVSQYMTRAAQTNHVRVAAQVESVLEWLEHELGS